MDENIIKAAKALVRAINKSGRTVMRPDVNEKGFGHMVIWIHNHNDIVVETYGENGFIVKGKIRNAKRKGEVNEQDKKA